MSNKLSELRELKEMYEIRLKSDNVDKSLKDHYQTMLDTINEHRISWDCLEIKEKRSSSQARSAKFVV